MTMMTTNVMAIWMKAKSDEAKTENPAPPVASPSGCAVKAWAWRILVSSNRLATPTCWSALTNAIMTTWPMSMKRPTISRLKLTAMAAMTSLGMFCCQETLLTPNMVPKAMMSMSATKPVLVRLRTISQPFLTTGWLMKLEYFNTGIKMCCMMSPMSDPRKPASQLMTPASKAANPPPTALANVETTPSADTGDAAKTNTPTTPNRAIPRTKNLCLPNQDILTKV